MEKRNGWEWFRVITPILVTINLFLLGQLSMQVSEMNQRIFQHMTNAELHIPRVEFENIRSQIGEMRQEIVATIRTLRRGGE